jgi:hypothetical protein
VLELVSAFYGGVLCSNWSYLFVSNEAISLRGCLCQMKQLVCGHIFVGSVCSKTCSSVC